MSKVASKSDLIHDFQADLHAILSTMLQVREHLEKDKEFCRSVIDLACQRRGQLLERWEAIKSDLKKSDQ